MKVSFLQFQNATNWTIIDQAPNVKPDILHVAVRKAPGVVIAELRKSSFDI